jgi:hypothetical protein
MPNTDRLTLICADGRSAFAPGESVEVDAEWQLAEPAREIELRLVWSTAGIGARDLDVVERRVIGAGRSGHGRHTLQLPESPYSFSGKLISLLWSLELIVDDGRCSVQLRIVVAPERREIVIGIPKASSA